MTSWGNEMRVYTAVARNENHGSYESVCQFPSSLLVKNLRQELEKLQQEESTGAPEVDVPEFSGRFSSTP